MVAAALARTGVRARNAVIGLTEVPACGTNAEVLAYHGLDGASIARTVQGLKPLGPQAPAFAKASARQALEPE